MNPTRENLNSTASPAQRLSALAAASVDGVGLASPAPWLALFVLYLLLCCALRFRREAAMRRAFNYPDRASMASMTNDDAQAIMKYIVDLEFPYLYNLSMQFGLFKVRTAPVVSVLFRILLFSVLSSDRCGSPGLRRCEWEC